MGILSLFFSFRSPLFVFLLLFYSLTPWSCGCTTCGMRLLWIVPCDCQIVVTCHIPNKWLSVPTLRIRGNDDNFTLTTYSNGTLILELVRNFSRIDFLSFHLSLVIRSPSCSLGFNYLHVTGHPRSTWLSSGAVPSELGWCWFVSHLSGLVVWALLYWTFLGFSLLIGKITHNTNYAMTKLKL